MKPSPQIFSQRPFSIFSGVLLCFLLLAYQLILHQQTQFVLHQEQQRMQVQLQLLGEFLAYSLAQRRGMEIKPMLLHWAAQQEQVLSIKVQADNLFNWVSYQRTMPQHLAAQDILPVNTRVNAYDMQLDIELRVDIRFIKVALKKQETQLLIISLLSFVCLSGVLWLLLSRIALRPLDQALREQLAEVQKLNAVLEQEKNFADTLLNATHAIILVADAQGKILQANQSFYHLSGFVAQELEQLSLPQLLPKLPVTLDAAPYAQNAIPLRYAETPLQRKDGALLCVDCLCSLQFGKQQQLHYQVFTCLDISERKRDENRLHQAAAVFENTAEGVVITDLRGCIQKINKAFTDTTGYEFAEVEGKTPALLQSGLQDTHFYQTMWESLQTGGRWQGEIINRRKSGEVYHEWLTISTVTNEFKQPINYVGVFSDISAMKKSQAQINYLSQHNDLTGLPNRLLLNDRLAHAIQRAVREQARIAVIMMDLDRLKDINMTLGHATGDDIIKRFAQRLQGAVRSEDTVAHLGADEFALMVEHIPHVDNATWIAKNLLNVFKQEYIIDGKEIFVSGSIGISLFPNDGANGDVLIQNAKTAMYEAKQNGGNNYRFYMKAMNAHSLELLLLESSLRRALEREELHVYYQPQFDLNKQRLIGMEALVRWFHPQQGMVSPGEFVPLAEESNLIVEIGHWVLHTACAQTKAWHDQGFNKLKVAVNLSARQFSHQDLAKEVASILEDTGLKAPFLKLELTESILLQKEDDVINTLQELQSMGVTLAIDDFGTGYSSLSYLKRFPISELKIDRSFVHDIEDVKQDAEIVSAIIGLGQRLHLGIVAEGIENQTQIDFLIKQGCQIGQGFFLGHPLDTKAFQALLDKRTGAWTAVFNKI